MILDPIGRIAGLAVVLAIILVFLRGRYPEVGVQLAIAFSVGVLLVVLRPLGQVLDVFGRLAEEAKIRPGFLEIVLKSIGVAYVAAFASQVSKDAGEEVVALVVELAAKVLILVLALPLVAAILESLIRLLPG